jgi:hypothetical protein
MSECPNFLLLKLKLSFDGLRALGGCAMAVSGEIPDDCFVEALELAVAIRAHLSLRLLGRAPGTASWTQSRASAGRPSSRSRADHFAIRRR